MKRILKFLFFLIVLPALIGGAFALGIFWDEVNPWDRTTDAELVAQWRNQLQLACLSDPALKDVALRDAKLAEGRISLQGIVGKKEQIAAVEAAGKNALDGFPRLVKRAPNGMTAADLKVSVIQDHLARLQQAFAEGKNTQILQRLTRVDSVAVNPDGKVVFTCVCLESDAKDRIRAAIKEQLEKSGEALPEFDVDARYHDYPILAMQKRLDQEERFKGVKLIGAWYEHDGKLHLEGIVANEVQRKPVEDAVGAMLRDEALKPLWNSPIQQAAAFTLRFDAFDSETAARDLQKKLSDDAGKQKSTQLHQVRLTKVTLDGEPAQKSGLQKYTYNVAADFLDTGSNRAELEAELRPWLRAQLPQLVGVDQSAVVPDLALKARAIPLAALQQRLVDRKLDGAVFTDLRFDALGRFELHGRRHKSGETTLQELRDAVADLLGEDGPNTILVMKPHLSRKDDAAIAWKDVLPDCQARLANSDSVGKRSRLDRLYFRYEKGKLVLDGNAVFLADAAAAPADLAKLLDDVITTRDNAAIAASLWKRIDYPLADLQQRIAEQPPLDGVLLTQLRYDSAGKLQFDGYLGAPEQKAALQNLLAARLPQVPGLLKPDGEAGWSMAGLVAHQSLKGKDQTWSEIQRAFQSDLAGSDDAALRRLRLDRSLFVYQEKPRRLTMQWKGTYLLRPQDAKIDPAVPQKIDALCKRLLPTLKLDEVEPVLQVAAAPIFALQAMALAKGFDGVFFKDAVYDAAGKLQIEGQYGRADQPKLLEAAIMQALTAKNKMIAPLGLASLASMKLVPWQPIVDEIRASFASDKSPLLKQTRIDRIDIEYEAATGKPRLVCKGVCIYQGKNPPADSLAAKWTDALKLQLKAKGLDGFDVAVDAIERRDNPAIELQRHVIDSGMDGVVFRVLGFDDKGTLRIHTLIPKGQEEKVRKLLADFTKKHPYLTPIQPLSRNGPARPSDSRFVVFQDKEKTEPPVDWQKLLADLREQFSRSLEPALQQTRIDRAYFSLNEDDPDQLPFLNFKGLCLRTVHDDEKRMKELLRKELSKVAIPGVKHVLKIDEFTFHDTPIYALQSAAVARRKNDPSLNVFFERATFGADGGFQLHILFLQDAPGEKIATLYQDDRPLPPELLQMPDGKTKPPSVIRRNYDWSAELKKLRGQYAADLDLLLQRTRLDAGHLAYTADNKGVVFHVDGVCVHPPALVAGDEREKRWKKTVSGLIPKVTYEPSVAGIAMFPNPSIAWQNDAADQETHDGIFFQLARFDAEGKLALGVMLPSEALRAAMLKLMTQKPVPAQLAPVGEKNLQVLLWNWKDVLPKTQTRLAQGDFLAHRTRIDRMFLKYEPKHGDPFLHFDGVSVHPTEVKSADEQRLVLERSFTDLLPIAIEHKLDTQRIRFLTSPIYALQAEAVSRNLDGLLFADGRYDEGGKLHLAVAVGTPAQREAARKIIDALPMPDGVIRPKDAKDQPIVEYTELVWSDNLKEMQYYLSRHSESLLKKTRLDRAFFSYPASKVGPDMNFLAVGIYPKSDSSTARLKRRLDAYILLTLAEQLRAGPVAAVPMIENVENPAPMVQAKVHETPALDGARLDDASFDREGKLLVYGIWVGKNQQKQMEKLIDATLKPAHPLLQRGINWGGLQEFDSPALVQQMREWVAGQEAIDEVWLERIYFDAGGKVRVAGFSTRPPDKDKAERGLVELLPKFPSRQLPPVDVDPPEKKPIKPVAFLQEPKDAGPIKLDQLPNIAEHLRGSIPKVTKCDGLRIDHCYYDPQGAFRIESLADRAGQTAELQPFLDGNDAPFDRKRQLAKGWKDGRQTVISLAPMIVSLTENLPALAEFDGLTLTRAYHDAKNRLVLSGNAIGDSDAKQQAVILKKLLETHPRWRLRTKAGVVVEVTDRKAADTELANRLVLRAIGLLQVNIGEASVVPVADKGDGWWSHAWPFEPKLPRVRPTDDDYDRCLKLLDAAIQNNPKNNQAWYLRGYCLQAKKRADLTLRDLRRMAVLEIDDQELRDNRILALELVQGVLRQSAYRIEQDAILQVSEGWTLRELKESPAAR